MRGASMANARTLPLWGVPNSMSSTSTSAMVRLILTCCEQRAHRPMAPSTAAARPYDKALSARTNDRHPDPRTLTEEGGVCQAVHARDESRPGRIPLQERCQLIIVGSEMLGEALAKC